MLPGISLLPSFAVPHLLLLHLLLLLLLERNRPLLVLAPLVLEPHPDDSLREAGHGGQLLLHDGVGPAVVVVEGVQHRQLLLVQHRPLSRRLASPLAACPLILAALPR